MIDLLVAFARRKRLLIGLPLLFAVAAALLSFSMHDVYRSTTKVLPRPEGQSNATAMLNQLGSLAGNGGALSLQIPIDPNSRIPIDLYVSMLKSRGVADNLIQRFDLKKVYGESLLEKTRQALARNTRITTGKDGLITIAVDDKDPKRATQVANAYVEELFKLAKSLRLTEASKRRLYFENQLRSAKNKLAGAEAALKAKAGDASVDIDAGSRAALESIARLHAQISAKEVQLGAMKAFAASDQQDYNRIQQEIYSMRAELTKLESGDRAGRALAEPTEKQGASDNIKLLHDVRYYDALSNLLEKEFENARFDEANDFSIIEVLEKAVEPENPYKPDRIFITMSAALVGLLLSICWILFFDVAVRSFAQQGQWEKLKSRLRTR